MVQIAFGISCLANAAELNSRGLIEKRLSSNSQLRVGTQCLWEKKSIHWEADCKCFTPAGTEMLVTTFTDAARCTFGDRQIAHESFFNCRKKSVCPVFVQAQRRFVTNYTLLISGSRLSAFPLLLKVLKAWKRHTDFVHSFCTLVSVLHHALLIEVELVYIHGLICTHVGQDEAVCGSDAMEICLWN